MRKHILLIILFTSSLNAQAEFKIVTVDENKTAYADSASILRHGSLVEMTGLFDFKSEHISDANKSYKSLKFRDEYNCDNRQKRNLGITVHADAMAHGEEIASYSETSKWQTVNAVAEAFWKLACEVQ